MRTMIKLNPYAAVLKRRASRATEKRALLKEAIALKKEGVCFIFQLKFLNVGS